MQNASISLDSQSRIPLFRQLADDLRRRISDGTYKVGEVLPGIHELARIYHASEKVPRKALELLAAEGLTRPCRGVGSTVAKSALEKSASAKESVSPPADGGVLIYAPMPGWSCSSVEEIYTMNRLLLDEGHRVTILTSAGSKIASMRRLRRFLKSRWSLVVTFGNNYLVEKMLMAADSPFAMVVYDADFPIQTRGRGCAWNCGGAFDRAYSDLAESCRRRGVKNVTLFAYRSAPTRQLERLARAGMAVETVLVPMQKTPDRIYRASALAFRRNCLGRGRKLPDLLLFSDDFVARGALLEMAAAGVRVPWDVKVASLVNRASGLAWPVPLCRIEFDPRAEGRAIARAVSAYLATGRFPELRIPDAVFKLGKTL